MQVNLRCTHLNAALFFCLKNNKTKRALRATGLMAEAIRELIALLVSTAILFLIILSNFEELSSSITILGLTDI